MIARVALSLLLFPPLLLAASPVALAQAVPEARDLGVAPGSLEANKLAWFVLSRVSDYRIYEVYQQAGFKVDAAKDLIVSILKDSAPYEVPKR